MTFSLDDARKGMELRGAFAESIRTCDELRTFLGISVNAHEAYTAKMEAAIATLTAERDAAIRERDEAREMCESAVARPGLTLTAEERAAVVFALGCLDATREKQRSRAPLSQLLAEADKHSATIDRLLAGARTVTEPTAEDVDFGEVGRMRERVARTYALSTEAGRSHALAVLRALVVDLQCAVAADAAARGGK